ncbi:thiopeptide-type bacteriocin biosynthesis protein [Muribaculum intestinale]|uniref:thiopeptide-type bacteriocin biosynthesis protein n=1 Tax=Muribaculum intestinale TaxID=1796646 RepID=UPI0025B5B7C6|nr:thiopeptide-type bacteriocin biosynthesis protein [Muribaculum intestinale]
MKQKFIPGDEWLYAKIYLPATRADSLIASLLPPITRLEKGRIIDKWFFIRYIDSQFHIRLRLHIPNPDRDLGQVIKVIKGIVSKYPAASCIDKIVYDTYVRELDRYGTYNIENCESFFHLDSRNTCCLLKGKYNEDTLWQRALTFIDAILDMYKYSSEEKLKFTSQAARDNLRYAGITDDNAKFFNVKYREYRSKINNWLSPDNINVQSAFGKDIQKVYTDILNTYPDCTSSLIHMHCNRLFSSDQRLCEATAYYFLSKHYSSIIARSATNKKENVCNP